jgi:ubiquinol-cytochrome c reductase cytochrome b subunit
MFSAILIILILPITDLGKTKGLQFRPISKIIFFVFVANFLILMQLGAKHVESPFIEFGQISTILYFSYFLVLTPLSAIIENTIMEIQENKTTNRKIMFVNGFYTMIANPKF